MVHLVKVVQDVLENVRVDVQDALELVKEVVLANALVDVKIVLQHVGMHYKILFV